MAKARVLGMVTLGVAMAASGAASAHGVHAESVGFAAGFTHPFLGLDHVLAMVAVGLWAGQLGGTARIAVPAGFVAAMGIGAALSGAIASVPGIEIGILASVVVLGLLVAARVRIATLLGAGLVGVFALFHGYAHGLEMPAAGGALGYGVGFGLATAALHGLGLGLAALFARRAIATRVAGAATAAAGVLLALA